MGSLQKITVCGGGNAGHVAVPLLAGRGCTVILYTPFEEEAARFREGLARGGIEAHLPCGRVFKGAPAKVTIDPEEASATDLLLLTVPAFAHGPLLQQLAPYLAPETTVAAIPARSGFDLQALHLLGNERAKRVIFCGQTLPWACRIEEYGHRVKVLGIKEAVGVATVPAHRAPDTATCLSKLLGVHFIPMANTLAVSLGNVGQVIHPGIMYGLLKNYRGEVWNEGEIPLFYQGVNEETAAVLEELSGEILKVAGILSREFSLALDEVVTVGQWLIRSYARYIEDSSSLTRAFRTNRSYRGLKLPVKKTAAGYVPDFQSRYLTEDVPFGLLFSKALAEMTGCATPYMDEVIRVTGGWMGKRYLDERGRPVGPDIGEARIPQNYGIHGAGQLVSASLRGYPAKM